MCTLLMVSNLRKYNTKKIKATVAEGKCGKNTDPFTTRLPGPTEK